MKNYSNTNSCISREVPNLTEENTKTITTKSFSILNHKGGWKQIWGGMKQSELDIYINKNEVHNFPLIMIKQNKNQNLLTVTSRFLRNKIETWLDNLNLIAMKALIASLAFVLTTSAPMGK